MKNKLLKQMVSASYNKNDLDEKKVLQFASYLDRKNLKEYIRALKQEEKKTTLTVSIPSNEEQYILKLQPLFPDKKIAYKIDPSLMLGISVTDNDSVYELNMRDSLKRIVNYLEEQI